jgi:ABC-type Fe3+/spermidine/putrescine transport system ATPase subunit
MTVADRIALIADGDLVEHGHARDIYVAPERTFTASFVGENNMLSGTVTKATKTSVSVDIGTGDPLVAETRGQKVAVGDKVSLSIRSELVKMTKGTAKTGTKAGHTLTGAYHEAVYLGLTTSHMITLPTGQDMVSRVVEDTAEPPKSGAPVRLSWKPGSLRLHVN